MPDIYVLPSETAAALDDEGLSVVLLKDADLIARQLSAPDVALIEMACRAYPFEFEDGLDVQTALTPLARLRESGRHEAFAERVEGCMENLRLQSIETDNKFTPVYTLNCVDENTWVAVQQRLHESSTDPSKLLLSSNRAYFDALIDQALHRHSFEKVCSGDLFRYYLGALPAPAA